MTQYAYVYNVAAQVVAVDAAVTFDSNAVLTAGFMHGLGAAGIGIVAPGVYKVSFSVSGTEPNQMAIFVNAAPVPGGIYGSGAGTQQNSGQAIVVTTGAGDVSPSGATRRPPGSGWPRSSVEPRRTSTRQ